MFGIIKIIPLFLKNNIVISRNKSVSHSQHQNDLHLRTVPTNNRSIFARFMNYAGKADLSKGYWNPKRKLRVTTHFSDIIKEQYFQKAPKYKAMYMNGIFS